MKWNNRKTRFSLIILLSLAIFILAFTAIAQNNQGYHLSRFYAGSSGSAQHPRFSMDLTVGQAEAGIMAAEGYILGGGFWGGGAAPQTSFTIYLPAISGRQ